MPISVECANCERVVRVKEEHAGRRIRCPDCSEVIVIPDTGADDGIGGGSAAPRRGSRRTRPSRGASAGKRNRRPKPASAWYVRHWHWLAALGMLLLAPWSKVTLAIAGLVSAVGVLMVLVGGLVPFLRILAGAPGTVLLMLVSRSARFDIMRQPDTHPYKVLCRTAFDPTRGLFWRGVLLTFTFVPAIVVHAQAEEFFRRRAANQALADAPAPPPGFGQPRNPRQPQNRPRGAAFGSPARPLPRPFPAGRGDEQPSRPSNAEAAAELPADADEFVVFVSYSDYAGTGSVAEAITAALETSSAYVEGSLVVDASANSVEFRTTDRQQAADVGRQLATGGFAGIRLRMQKARD